ncbi:MAG: hypothetical protein Q7U64_13415 [Desulfocapsaceae bacterium]|jgi:hypothetical protein|nr:hypothetical protein [Desulfocapsaceae bacterium]
MPIIEMVLPFCNCFTNTPAAGLLISEGLVSHHAGSFVTEVIKDREKIVR